MATIPSLQGMTRPHAARDTHAYDVAVDLSRYEANYRRGRPWLVVALWYCVNAIVFNSSLLPLRRFKPALLRLFGAKVGKGVVVKPRVNIKYPWNVSIGDHSWIGEGSWLDSLGQITIGRNVCISQGVYLCTGSHDWSRPGFDLIVKPIVIEDGVWLGCRTQVLGGVTLSSHAVLAAGSTLSQDAEAFMIYRGNPAKPVKVRHLHDQPEAAKAAPAQPRRFRLVFPDHATARPQTAAGMAMASTAR